MGEEDKPKLNQRKATFISEYLKTGNATESAVRAGYSGKTAYSIGQRLLKNVEIQKKIEKHREEISREAELTIAEVVKEIRGLSRGAKLETNRLKALDMLMKHLGGYVNELRIIENLTDDQVEKMYQKIIDKMELP